jgi:hypothetical protein
MKRIFSVALLTGYAVLLLSSVTIAQQTTPPPPPPPPAPKAPKTEKHIKMVKVDDNGKKVEIDTVLTSDQPFIWNGDTIGGGDDFKFEMAPMPPGVPMPPHVMMLRSHANRNVIDLSDPGIISYDKKIQKDGTEKITIVRKQVPEGEDAPEDVLMHSPHCSDAFFYGNSPEHFKTIKVIKSDDGTTKIIEDGNVMHMEGGEGTTKFMGDDGKVIIVKEIKEGDENKVEVEVEEKVEKVEKEKK